MPRGGIRATIQERFLSPRNRCAHHALSARHGGGDTTSPHMTKTEEIVARLVTAGGTQRLGIASARLRRRTQARWLVYTVKDRCQGEECQQGRATDKGKRREAGRSIAHNNRRGAGKTNYILLPIFSVWKVLKI